jgi:site-specific recombinase XerD
VQQVALFARHFRQSPDALGPEEIRAYQLYLTNERKLATGSILIAVAALRFLYKVTLHKDWTVDDVIPAPKKPQTLPVVLSPEEVLQFLGCVQGLKHRTLLTTCYAAGLRISEAVRLKVTDIDSKRMVIRIRGLGSNGTEKGVKAFTFLNTWPDSYSGGSPSAARNALRCSW